MVNRKEMKKVWISSDAKNTIEMISQGNRKNGILASIRKLLEEAKNKDWKRDIEWAERKTEGIKKAHKKAREVEVREGEWVIFADKSVSRRMGNE